MHWNKVVMVSVTIQRPLSGTTSDGIKYIRVSGPAIFTRFSPSQHTQGWETNQEVTCQLQLFLNKDKHGCSSRLWWSKNKENILHSQPFHELPTLEAFPSLVLGILLSFYGHDIRVYSHTIPKVFPEPKGPSMREGTENLEIYIPQLSQHEAL